MPVRIFIADDHSLLRQGIKDILQLEPDLVVVGEAADGEEVLRKIGPAAPDVLLLDINMPKLNGLEVIRRVRAAYPAVRIVALTIHDDENYVVEVIKAGAVGYILKDVEPGMLVKAIRLVHEGEFFVYPTLAKKLFGTIVKNSEFSPGAASARMLKRNKDERLTYREIEVLQLICQGLSNYEIAKKLYLSEKTVKNHLTNIFRKINVNDRTQAVLYAIKHKLVALE